MPLNLPQQLIRNIVIRQRVLVFEYLIKTLFFAADLIQPAAYVLRIR